MKGDVEELFLCPGKSSTAVSAGRQQNKNTGGQRRMGPWSLKGTCVTPGSLITGLEAKDKGSCLELQSAPGESVEVGECGVWGQGSEVLPTQQLCS